MKALQLSVFQWQRVRLELHKEYPKTVFMLKDKMKKVLGFTVREHKAWIPNPNPTDYEWDKGHTEVQIHLDFYSENKRTMFLLKFSDIIGAPSDKL